MTELQPIPHSLSDAELLAHFAPVLAFTQGELFFPMRVDPYVQACSLWVSHPDGSSDLVLPAGQVSLDTLGRLAPPGENSVYFLRLVAPEDRDALGTYLKLLERRDFKVSRGRLVRVGLFSRILDTLFSITLLMRGRVPGGTAAVARDYYQKVLAEQPHYTYYGRVLRRDGYITLQYWYFYCMNDWRTGYNGVNDHEADWEQVTIYCTTTPNGQVQPTWLALASHDASGADLRRRWDDPMLTFRGRHPVVYVAAGSHAAYFKAGEYMHNVSTPFSGVFTRISEPLSKFWRDILRLHAEDNNNHHAPGTLTIPFVDYARGDGKWLGAGQPEDWECVAVPFSEGRDLDAEFAWAEEYRGLWGLYARDPMAGENAPAGMKFNRDGTVRHAWYDPLGWASLEMVPPLNETSPLITQRIADIRHENTQLREQSTALRSHMKELYLELEAMRGQTHFGQAIKDHQLQLNTLAEQLRETGAKMTSNRALIESLEDLQMRFESGIQAGPEAHLQHAHSPLSEDARRLGVLAEAWAALSVGLLLITFVVVLVLAPTFWFTSLAAMLGTAVFVEALFQRRARNLIRQVALVLAIIAIAVLVYQFFGPLLVLAVLAIGLFILYENFTELLGR